MADGGPMLAFTDYTLNETFYDPLILERAGLSADSAWSRRLVRRCPARCAAAGGRAAQLHPAIQEVATTAVARLTGSCTTCPGAMEFPYGMMPLPCKIPGLPWSPVIHSAL